MTYHDARCPAVGVRVAPMVRCGYEKLQGLTMGQTAAARKTNPTTPEHKRGGTFSAGAGTFARVLIRRPGVYRDRTPGRKGPSQAVKRKTNSVFRGPKITKGMLSRQTGEEEERRDMDELVYRCVRAFSGLTRETEASKASYRALRNAFIERYSPAACRELARLECEIRKGWVPTKVQVPTVLDQVRALNEARRRGLVQPSFNHTEPKPLTVFVADARAR